MSRSLFLLFGCAVSLFIISVPLYAVEPAIPQQVLDWQKEAQDGIAHNDLAGAVEVYLKIQKAYPDTKYAADAQKQVVLAYLRANQSDKALLSLSEFSQKYSLQPGYLSQMGEIINRMADVNMASQAKEACQSLLERFGDNPEMLWILQRKSRCEIFMKKPDLADQTVKVMQQKYAACPQYADALSWTAYEYRRIGFFTQAAGLYKSILAQNPPANIQLRCRSGLVLTDIGLGDMDNATKEAQQMRAAILLYREYIQMTELEEVINALTDAGQAGSAQEICQAAVEQFADTPQLLWIWQRKARSEVFLKKYELAEESVKVMQQKYAAHPEYADALSWTAYEYLKNGFYPRAMELYDEALSLNPSREIQLRCIAGKSRIYVRFVEDANVQEMMDYLPSNFKDDPNNQAMYLFEIAEEYLSIADELSRSDKTPETTDNFQKAITIQDQASDLSEQAIANYRNAVSIFDILIRTMPQSNYAVQGCFFAADVGRILRDHDMTLNYYEQLLDLKPDYDKAWHAHFIIADSLETLFTTGTQPPPEEIKTRIIYHCSRVMKDWPNCPAARAAEAMFSRYCNQPCDKEAGHE
jgi:tetratricopeptide (TPR) repeat protein